MAVEKLSFVNYNVKVFMKGGFKCLKFVKYVEKDLLLAIL